MHHFEAPPAPPKPIVARRVCALAIALLTLPSIVVWVVRGVAALLHCLPQARACSAFPIGMAFDYSLGAAWFLGANALLCMALAFVAALAALWARRPLLAALNMLLLPIAAVLLPTFAVYSSLYPGCEANEAGVGSCILWGASMGMNFHNAAIAQSMIYDFVPYSAALSLMILAIGLLFFRPQRQA